VIKGDGTVVVNNDQVSELKIVADGQAGNAAGRWTKFWSNFHTAHGSQATIFIDQNAFAKKHRVVSCTFTKVNAHWKVTTPDIYDRNSNIGSASDLFDAGTRIEFSPFITLSHELLHAWRHMQGTLVSKQTTFGSDLTKIGDAKPHSISASWAGFGESIEEWITVHGVTGLKDADGNNVNENTIRAEAGEAARGCYVPFDMAGSNI